jgi:hypothetical protein
VDVDVQIERSAESLDDCDGASARLLEAEGARAVPQQAEHGAQEHGGHTPAQVVVPREPVPQPVRQTQHPLPNRHVRKDASARLCRARPPAVWLADAGLHTGLGIQGTGAAGR